MPRRPRLAKAFVATATYLRIATYTRRSTNEENQPFTIEAQDTKLDAYATSQDGWNIVAKFSDDASGASVDRPGLERAIAAAKAGRRSLVDKPLVERGKVIWIGKRTQRHEISGAGGGPAQARPARFAGRQHDAAAVTTALQTSGWPWQQSRIRKSMSDDNAG